MSHLALFLDDDSNSLTLPSDPPVPVKTTWTLLLYLTSASEGCVGGETVFYPHDRQLAAEEIAVPLETGMLLLHKHGDDCLLVSHFNIASPICLSKLCFPSLSPSTGHIRRWFPLLSPQTLAVRGAAKPFSQSLIMLWLAYSMKGGKSKPARSGFYEPICVYGSESDP